MAKTVEFLFDFVSPAAYVAYKRLPEILERTGATVDFQPIFLGGIMQGSGNSPPFTVPNKGRYTGMDLARFVKKYGIPYTQNPHFPILTLSVVRMATALKGTETFPALVDTLFNAMWRDGLNLGDKAVVAHVLTDAGLDAAAIMALADDPAVKQAAKDNVDAAVARGVFGSPTFFVDGEMWFGQDRLDWVEEALAA